ncbi:hypothetical protein CDV36_007518 [Fusarium kuroshium]|uniref:PRISE-like Rossmann-fold domain-containing protein n=1 Tax=Fusarium kuroshium TaxID=2010991 RepID=A0A3M2S5H8_9HYPO|nr:hypothetical protein CDV36_007518 [Fusarium kuroshium]
MSSSDYPLRQSGIYHNLPTFDPTIKNLSAIVCGANGISGFNTVRALLDSPDRWATIYTLSRHPLSEKQLSLIPSALHGRIKHVPVDLSDSPEKVAGDLVGAGVHADYVFYYTYAQPSSDGETFLKALEIADIEPKRILLQTGGKNYGMHIGRVRTPLVESDPQPRHLSKNFYYAQEDDLKAFCSRHSTGWNVVRPAGVIGASPNSPLNIFWPFAIYAAIQARKGEPLEFGGTFESWQFEAGHSTARLSGYLSEWDGGLLSWNRFFSELARWFGVYKGVVPPKVDDKFTIAISLAGGEQAPLGYGPPLNLDLKFSLAEWFKGPTNKSAWEEIMADSDVTANPFADGTAAEMMGDFAYLRFGTLSMNKARIYGFSGFVDSCESIFESFVDMERLGLLPPMKVSAARALV